MKPLIAMALVFTFLPLWGAKQDKPVSRPIEVVFVYEMSWDFAPPQFSILQVELGPRPRARRVDATVVDSYCPGYADIKATIWEDAPTELIKKLEQAPICSLDVGKANRALRKSRQKGLVFSTALPKIAARCGDGVHTVDFGSVVNLDSDRLRHKSPDTYRLYIMMRDIGALSPTESTRMEALAVASELSHGLMAEALAGSDLLRLLRQLRVGAPESNVIVKGVTPENMVAFDSPTYPPLARLARVSGKVSGVITVDSESGRVVSIDGLSGHPMLIGAVRDTVNKWRFLPNSPVIVPIDVTFWQDCPPASSN